MLNFYQRMPKALKPKYHNPGLAKHGIEIPARILIAGPSGSGKTNLLLNLIAQMEDTFHHITVCTRNADEPLYNFLKTKVPEGQLSIVEGVEQIPDLETLDPNAQHLVVFDDLVLAKDQSRIEEYFIRARKIAKGVSVVYLTQSYFRTPKTIRINCGYIFLKRLSSTRDLGIILSEYGLGVDRKEMTRLYAEATTKPLDFLYISTDRREFRINFGTPIA
jgi:energy-coupling factor transporter ATP-binding protein EcfA2